jgi:hypothetical protein
MPASAAFLAFARLWAVLLLQDAHGMSRVAAAEHSSPAAAGVARIMGIGMISDRLGSRRGLMRAAVLLYTCRGCRGCCMRTGRSGRLFVWFLLMGLVIPGFTLSWTIAKEGRPGAVSGIATSVVNTGIFLGAGILQPLVGWVLDRGKDSGDLAAAWDRGLMVLAGAAAMPSSPPRCQRASLGESVSMRFRRSQAFVASFTGCCTVTSTMAIDLTPLWDFSQPELSEQRFRRTADCQR